MKIKHAKGGKMLFEGIPSCCTAPVMISEVGVSSSLCWPSLRSLTLRHIQALFLSPSGARDDQDSGAFSVIWEEQVIDRTV